MLSDRAPRIRIRGTLSGRLAPKFKGCVLFRLAGTTQFPRKRVHMFIYLFLHYACIGGQTTWGAKMLRQARWPLSCPPSAYHPVSRSFQEPTPGMEYGSSWPRRCPDTMGALAHPCVHAFCPVREKGCWFCRSKSLAAVCTQPSVPQEPPKELQGPPGHAAGTGEGGREEKET